MPNISLIGHLISSWQSEQLPLSVATTKKHITAKLTFYNNRASDIYMHIHMFRITCLMAARIWLKNSRYDLQIRESNLG